MNVEDSAADRTEDRSADGGTSVSAIDRQPLRQGPPLVRAYWAIAGLLGIIAGVILGIATVAMVEGPLLQAGIAVGVPVAVALATVGIATLGWRLGRYPRR